MSRSRRQRVQKHRWCPCWYCTRMPRAHRLEPLLKREARQHEQNDLAPTTCDTCGVDGCAP